MSALEEILSEARAAVASGRAPNVEGMRVRIAAVASSTDAQADALAQLDRIVAVQRAKARLAREPAPRTFRAPVVLKTMPTVTGSLDVRRGQGDRLEWPADPKVDEWEVRISERPNARADYKEISSAVLAARETSIELPLGENALRVSVVGRVRGKVQRRALVSGLTRDGWRAKWTRRASAS